LLLGERQSSNNLNQKKKAETKSSKGRHHPHAVPDLDKFIVNTGSENHGPHRLSQVLLYGREVAHQLKTGHDLTHYFHKLASENNTTEEEERAKYYACRLFNSKPNNSNEKPILGSKCESPHITEEKQKEKKRLTQADSPSAISQQITILLQKKRKIDQEIEFLRNEHKEAIERRQLELNEQLNRLQNQKLDLDNHLY